MTTCIPGWGRQPIVVTQVFFCPRREGPLKFFSWKKQRRILATVAGVLSACARFGSLWHALFLSQNDNKIRARLDALAQNATIGDDLH